MPKPSQYRLTGETPEIDVRRWRKRGHLEPGHRFISRWLDGNEPYASMNVHVESRSRIWLSYRYREDNLIEDCLYPVGVDWTPCNLGGHRPWFLCPNPACGRRCAILYMGRMFWCRECSRLRYPSQREPRYDRLARRAEKIRERLSWTPGILVGPEPKPKHMHWSTFWQLISEHDHYACAAVANAKPLLRVSSAGGIPESYKPFPSHR